MAILKSSFSYTCRGKREAPEAGEIFVQKDLLETLKKW